jgi:SAM-dependent methyltransferase
MSAPPQEPFVRWEEHGEPRQARWRSEAGRPVPARVRLADDQTSADLAARLAAEGTALLWRGDFQSARQLLQALARRLDRAERRSHGRRGAPAHPGQPAPPSPDAAAASAAAASMSSPAGSSVAAADFYRHRQAQGHRARVLGMLLIEVGGDGRVGLRRAPDLRAAFEEAWGPADGQPCVVALREVLGLVGAHEWRKQGLEVPALGPPPDNRIHAHYGVFSPVRGEYLDLVAAAPLPADAAFAWDIGTGTGVIAAVLARRGVARVVATDLNPRALDCARDNIARLGLQAQVEVVAADLFPPGTAPLIVCNPPWLPGKPSSPLEQAVYDPDSRMLRGFLAGLAPRLAPGGEGWLVLSDLAEHLGLRTRGQLQALFDAGGLVVRDRLDIRPRHPKATDAGDPLAAARGREVTSLWRLGVG